MSKNWQYSEWSMAKATEVVEELDRRRRSGLPVPEHQIIAAAIEDAFKAAGASDRPSAKVIPFEGALVALSIKDAP